MNKLNSKDRKEKIYNIYSCGPTTYSLPHIGNIRTLYTAKVYCNFLRLKGLKVKFCMNYTDVDDKIIQRAKECNTTFSNFRATMLSECDQLLKSLKIVDKNVITPCVTDYIGDIMSLIDHLFFKKLAYYKEDGIYCKIIPENYFKIDSKRKKEVTEEDDFVIWRKYNSETDQPFWNYKGMLGRPGWHIECAAFISSIFKGEKVIHTHFGGCDLKFPHHENEFYILNTLGIEVQNWFHVGFLTYNKYKISKSDNTTIINLVDITDKTNVENLYFLFLSMNCVKNLNFSFSILRQKTIELQILLKKIKQIENLNIKTDKEIYNSIVDSILKLNFATGLGILNNGIKNKKISWHDSIKIIENLMLV